MNRSIYVLLVFFSYGAKSVNEELFHSWVQLNIRLAIFDFQASFTYSKSTAWKAFLWNKYPLRITGLCWTCSCRYVDDRPMVIDYKNLDLYEISCVCNKIFLSVIVSFLSLGGAQAIYFNVE